MFKKLKNIGSNLTYPDRSCWLYISEKFNEILFVPMGKIEDGILMEVDSVICKDWPLNIDEIQGHIKTTLDKYENELKAELVKTDSWYSFKNSKAKTQNSFNVEYVQIKLETDQFNSYNKGESERIIVSASPINWNEDSYRITAKTHLIDTSVAQKVLDIYGACLKIRG